MQASSSPYFGVVVGRCANRIEGASFTLDGKIYELTANNGPNALHGGTKGFDKQMWSAESIEHPDGSAVRLTRTSPDGEEVYACMHIICVWTSWRLHASGACTHAFLALAASPADS